MEPLDAEPEQDLEPGDPDSRGPTPPRSGLPMGSRIQEGEWLYVHPDVSPFEMPEGGDELAEEE